MTPAVVIGGYLGAGKTTLVNHLLAGGHGRRVTVLVNDFGAVNIDADLIENQDGDTISLSNGCACCTIGNDLLAAAKRAVEVDSAPEILLIEASGAAEPARMAVNLLGVAELQPARLLTVVDGNSIKQRLRDKFVGQLARRQIAQAHQLLFNRFPPGGRPDDVIDVGSDLPEPFEELDSAVDWIVSDRVNHAVAEAPDISPDHGLRSVHLVFHTAIPQSQLQRLQAKLPAAVHRVKGFIDVVNSEGDSTWQEIQYAGGRWDMRQAAARDKAELVIIGTFSATAGEQLEKVWSAV